MRGMIASVSGVKSAVSHWMLSCASRLVSPVSCAVCHCLESGYSLACAMLAGGEVSTLLSVGIGCFLGCLAVNAVVILLVGSLVLWY